MQQGVKACPQPGVPRYARSLILYTYAARMHNLRELMSNESSVVA